MDCQNALVVFLTGNKNSPLLCERPRTRAEYSGQRGELVAEKDTILVLDQL